MRRLDKVRRDVEGWGMENKVMEIEKFWRTITKNKRIVVDNASFH